MLSLIYQRRIHPRKTDFLERLTHSGNPEVARIAGRILDASLAGGKTFPPERLGTSFRVSRRDRLPYILHVPKDYRGDRPFPLIIYLSGGAGLAIDAVNSSEDVIAPTGYLALYPQTGDMWWNDDIRQKFASLFDETLDTLNVDRQRIYITGFSNGGTGALYYATFWPKRFAAVVTMMGAGVCMPEVSRRLMRRTTFRPCCYMGIKIRSFLSVARETLTMRFAKLPRRCHHSYRFSRAWGMRLLCRVMKGRR